MLTVVINVFLCLLFAVTLWAVGIALGTYWWFLRKGFTIGVSLMDMAWKKKDKENVSKT